MMIRLKGRHALVYVYFLTLLVIISAYYEGVLVTLNTIKQLFYGLYLTNSFGYRLSKVNDPMEIKRLRLAYSEAQLDTLHVSVKIENPDLPIRRHSLILYMFQ
jgi:hypothetical protein